MRYLPAAVLATSLVGTVASAPSGASAKTLSSLTVNGKKAVIVKQAGKQCNVHKELDKLGISISSCPSLSWLCGDFSCIQRPSVNKPGTGKPDNSQKPEQKPDQGGTENDSHNPEDESFAGQVVTLVNQERAKAGLPALTVKKNIAGAAFVRAKEIEKSFSHTRPNGSSFSTALTESGVSFQGAGENIAWGQSSPEEVMKGWMNSDGHRANILNKNFTSIGVGYYKSSTGRTYWTQLFTY